MNLESNLMGPMAQERMLYKMLGTLKSQIPGSINDRLINMFNIARSTPRLSVQQIQNEKEELQMNILKSIFVSIVILSGYATKRRLLKTATNVFRSVVSMRSAQEANNGFNERPERPLRPSSRRRNQS